jgi:hypothetical protein
MTLASEPAPCGTQRTRQPGLRAAGRFRSLLLPLMLRRRRWRPTLHPLAEILTYLSEFRGARSPVIIVARCMQPQCHGRGYKCGRYLCDGIFTQFFAPAFRATHRKLNRRFGHGCVSLLSCGNESPFYRAPVNTHSGNSANERNLRARQKKTRAAPQKGESLRIPPNAREEICGDHPLKNKRPTLVSRQSTQVTP